MILDSFNFKKALEDNKLIILYFTATWCGPCKMFGPVVEDFSNKHSVIVGKIDVDEEKDIADEYYISSVPTVIVIEDGKEVHRSIGAIPLIKLEKELEQWI